MSNTEFLAEFVNKRITEVFVEYEGPKVYSFLTKLDSLFLAYFCSEDAQKQQWFYIPASEGRLARLLRDQESIRSFILGSPAIYLATCGFDGLDHKIVRHFPADLPTDFLPENNVYLETPTSNFSIKIEKQGISPTNVQETSLVKLVGSVHKAIKRVMRELKQQSPSTYNGCNLEPMLAITGIYPGSVEIRMKAIEHNPLIGDALNEVQRVMTASKDNLGNESKEDQKVRAVIQKELFQVMPNPKSRLFNFDSISLFGKATGINASKSVNVVFTPEQREKFVEEVKTQKSQTRSIVLKGLIREIDKDYESFMLRNLADNELGLSEVKCTFDGNGPDVDIEDIQTLLVSDAFAEISGDYSLLDRALEVRKVQTVAETPQKNG